jgi:hypothetical protein
VVLSTPYENRPVTAPVEAVGDVPVDIDGPDDDD